MNTGIRVKNLELLRGFGEGFFEFACLFLPYVRERQHSQRVLILWSLLSFHVFPAHAQACACCTQGDVWTWTWNLPIQDCLTEYVLLWHHCLVPAVFKWVTWLHRINIHTHMHIHTDAHAFTYKIPKLYAPLFLVRIYGPGYVYMLVFLKQVEALSNKLSRDNQL